MEFQKLLTARNKAVVIHDKLKHLLNYKKQLVSLMNFYEVLVGTELGLIIDVLTCVNSLGSYNNIARGIFEKLSYNGFNYFNHRLILGYLKKIMRLNIIPVAKVRYDKIGLNILFVFIPRYIELKNVPSRDWLFSYIPSTYPYGTILVYYIPVSLAEELIINIKKKISKISDKFTVLLYEKVERYQPYFNDKYTFYLTDHISKLITGYTREELYNTLENNDNTYIDLINQTERNKPNDIVDLILLKEFQYNAFRTLQHIIQNHNVTYKSLRKHLEKHVISQELIEGVFLPASLFLSFTNRFLRIFRLSFSDKYSFDLAVRFFRRIVYTIGIYYASNTIARKYNTIVDNNEYELITILYVPQYNDINFYNFIYSEIADQQKMVDVYETASENMYKYTIPYTNYDQEAKDWTIYTEFAYKMYTKRMVI